MWKLVLIVLFSSPLLALCQIDSKNLVGQWCVEKVTAVAQQIGDKEIVQTQIMDEFQGVIMFFSGDGEYLLYLEDLSETDEFQEFANYSFISTESKVRIQYPETSETIDYQVEKLTKNECIFTLQDEFGALRTLETCSQLPS